MPDPTKHGDPSNFAAIGDTVFFTATDADHGRELWKTDGTEAGTVLVKDVFPGTTGSSPTLLTNANGTLFFAATGLGDGVELWKSDGTEAGTVLVKNINPAGGAAIDAMVASGGTVFFSANDGTSGLELWMSDGTAPGTFLVKDLVVGTGSSSPTSLTMVGGVLYFVATVDSYGTELWTSDGTAAGTRIVANLTPTAFANTSPDSLTVVGNTLFFRAAQPSGIFRTDGSSAGTVQVESGATSQLAAVGNALFYAGSGNGLGVELWKYDTATATRSLVKDIYASGSSSSSPAGIIEVGGIAYFAATDAANGRELWRSDGTGSGTLLVGDIAASSTGSSPASMTPFRGGVLFTAARDLAGGTELWRSDGTAAGTVLVKDLRPDSGKSSNPARITVVGNVAFFVADDGVHGRELWKTDGTEAGTVLVKDIDPGARPSSGIRSFLQFGDRLVFVASDGLTGAEPWVTDGTAAGTTLLKDVNPGANGSNPTSMTVVGDWLFFVADDGTTGEELWRSDGTTAGTVPVADLVAGPTGSVPAGLTAWNGALYFRATTTSAGNELWKVEPPDGSPTLVRDIAAGTGSSSPTGFTPAGNALVFVATTPSQGAELWRTDGTTAGTFLLSDIYPGSLGSSIAAMAPCGTRVCFSANDANRGVEPWITDGTVAGTRLLADIYTSSFGGGSSPSTFTPLGNRFIFAATSAAAGRELFVSDGITVASLLKDIRAGSSSSNPWSFVPFGNRVLFLATDASGEEPWVTDGTSAGTFRLADIAAGATSSYCSPFTVAGGTAFFTATGASGFELWQTDGTVARTQRVLATAAGEDFSVPTGLFVVGDHVLFQATDSARGAELWKARAGGGASLVQDLQPGTISGAPLSFFRLGSQIVFTARDDDGDRELFIVPASDVDPPAVLLCPPALTVEATGADGASVSYVVAATDDGLAVTPSYSIPPGSTLALGRHLVTASFVDGLGSRSECTFEVNVTDTTAPTVTCPGDIAVITGSRDGLAVPFDATATDTVTLAPSLTYSAQPGSVFPVGVTTVSVTAADERQNTATCSFSVLVTLDDAPPALQCPDDLSIEAVSSTGAVATFQATASDERGEPPLLAYSRPSGTVFPLGRTAVEVTATDPVGNRSRCSFNVDVVDTTRPQLVCPPAMTVEATSPAGAVVTYGDPMGTDTVSGVAFSASPERGATFPLGRSAVTVTATDGAGNVAACSFDVQVVDTTAPTMAVPANVTVEAASAEGATVTFPAPTAQDAVSTPILGAEPGSGARFPLGTTAVVVTATDAAGNAARGHFLVTVADRQPPTVTCPQKVEVAAQSSEGAQVELPLPVASDAVTARPIVTLEPPSGTVFPPGESTVTARARDLAGNASECSFTVSVGTADALSPGPRRPTEVKTQVPQTGCASTTGDLGAFAMLLLVLGFPRRWRGLLRSRPASRRLTVGSAATLLAAMLAGGCTKYVEDVELTCGDGWTLCGDSCWDLQNDVTHCGTCDRACRSNESCEAGECRCTTNCGTVTLEVALAGDGHGRVTSTPGALDCEASCSATFDAGTRVELAAHPGPGSVFLGWAGADCGTSSTCDVELTRAVGLTATFASGSVLEVNRTGNGHGRIVSEPAGISCGTDCAAPFLSGTHVTFAAVPEDDSTFEGWTGAGCSGTGACTVAVEGAEHVSAAFKLKPMRLIVQAAGDGGGGVSSAPSGIDCGSTCEATFEGGTAITLSATPDARSDFAGWSGACVGPGPCLVALDVPRTVVANFSLKAMSLAVRLSGDGRGSVTSSPAGIDCGAACTASYKWGTTVELTARPAAGSVFHRWNGACHGSGTCRVTLDDAKAVEAEFWSPPGTVAWEKLYGAQELWIDTDSDLTRTGMLAVDANENLYVSGYYSVYVGLSGSRVDAGVARFDRDGTKTLVERDPSWVGGSTVRGIAADAQGNFYVSWGSMGGGIVKYAATGPRLWSATPEGIRVALAPNGDVVAGGGSGARRLSPDGALLWTSPVAAGGGAVAVDPANGILLWTAASKGGTVVSSVTRFRADGTVDWVRELADAGGGARELRITAVAGNAAGETFAAGSLTDRSTSKSTALLLKLDVDGNEVWRDTFGHLPNEGNLTSLAITPEGGVVVAGSAFRPGPITGSWVEIAYVGHYDGSGPAPVWEMPFEATALSVADGVAVVGSSIYLAGSTMRSGSSKIFIAKLHL